jgi:tetratricopeptide (TPR) repeat protein
LTPERTAELEDQYKLALQDLNNLKFDLYLSDNELYIEALHVFEEELKNNPADVKLLNGYASLLEKSDKAKAMVKYQEVIRIDPRNAIALFNLGALHYSRGKELLETAQKTTDDNQYKILVEGAMNDFNLAKPYFERALAEDPGALETIQALKTISFVLDDQEAYQKYKEMENSAGK